MNQGNRGRLEDLLERGMSAHRAGDVNTALAAYREVLKLDPGQPDALHRMAEIAVRQGQPGRAIDYLDRALQSRPDHFPARYARGSLKAAAGRAEEAERDFRAAVGQRPEHAASWGELARVLQATGRLAEALDAARESVRLDPANPALGNNLGLILEALGRLEEAAGAYRAALGRSGGSMAAWNNLGNVLNKLDRLEEAEQAFSRALAFGEHPVVRASLAGVLHRRGQAERADQACRQALAAPAAGADYATARASVATVYEGLGRLDEARAAARAGLQRAPEDPQLNWVLARCERRSGDFSSALDHLDRAARGRLSLRWRHSIAFERGRNLDLLGRTDEAWEAFCEANRAALEHWRSLESGPNRYRARLEAFAAGFTREQAAAWSPLPEPADGRADPVFLVGFPRSGTTLIDQILNAHPAIRVLEERPMLARALERLEAMPGEELEVLARLDEGERDDLRQAYFSELDLQLSGDTPGRVIDKLPLNAANAAFIHRLFPRARFILAVRHPADVCLSCFMQEFGLNEAMANLFDLDDIAALYRLVMELWQRSAEFLPLEALTVRYEDVVADLPGQAERLLEFLELDWDDRVLDPAAEARRRGHINTPSYHQVTRPVYTDAVDRWRRYREHLAPWLPGLEPFAGRYGYRL